MQHRNYSITGSTDYRSTYGACKSMLLTFFGDWFCLGELYFFVYFFIFAFVRLKFFVLFLFVCLFVCFVVVVVCFCFQTKFHVVCLYCVWL